MFTCRMRPQYPATSDCSCWSCGEAFKEAGARVERDFSTPGGRAVRIYLPLRVAMDMTEAQAKTLAFAAESDGVP